MKNNILTNIHLKRYLDLSLLNLSNIKITSEYYNFRCNICGDSKKNSRKKRGYILINKDVWKFKCHNCGVVMNAVDWLKQFHPIHYSNYIKDVLKNSSKLSDEQKIKKMQNELKKRREYEKFKNAKEEKQDIKCFVPIQKGTDKLCQTAIDYCNSRQIPESIWKTWFVATGRKYFGRLIIPFLDENKKIYYWQARTLRNQIPKYLNRVEEKDNIVYNINNINTIEPVVITEGIIDSLFIENSIAVIGLSISKKTFITLEKLKTYYILDCDIAGIKKSKQLLRSGKQVFLWKKFIKDFNLPKRTKWDFNEVYIYLKRESIFLFAELEKYFSNNMFDSLYI